MTKVTPDQLIESIEALTSYRNRLKDEVISIAQKLRIPQQQINSTLNEHEELKKIEPILSKLIELREELYDSNNN